MIIVLVDFAVAPQDRAFALATLRAEAPVVRAMPGNLGYHLRTDPGAEGGMTLVHEWTDADAFAAYRASDTFRAVGSALFPKMVGTPSTRIFNALPVAA